MCWPLRSRFWLLILWGLGCGSSGKQLLLDCGQHMQGFWGHYFDFLANIALLMEIVMPKLKISSERFSVLGPIDIPQPSHALPWE